MVRYSTSDDLKPEQVNRWFQLHGYDYQGSKLQNLLEDAQDIMKQLGVDPDGRGYRSVSPIAGAILIMEAVNGLTKEIDRKLQGDDKDAYEMSGEAYTRSELVGFKSQLYDLKSDLFPAIAEAGKDALVRVYKSKDDAGKVVWGMCHPEIGTVRFHDPLDNITNRIKRTHVSFMQPSPWSGYRRRDDSLAMLESPELVARYARLTRPEFNENETGNFVVRYATNRPTNTIALEDILAQNSVQPLSFAGRENARESCDYLPDF